MPTSILATKLYIPPLRPNLVRRPRLIDRLNVGLHGKLTLVSAPAGFGKTTLIREWIDSCAQRVAWLSLDEEESDPARFLTYLVAALQTLAVDMGEGVLGALQAPQPPSMTTLLTALLNESATLPDHCLLVLDDYHLLDAGNPLRAIDQALTFLIEHLPPQLHLIITTREDPNFPLARYRARGQLTEVRAADLRFTPDEAAEFFNGMMGLKLAPETIAALEARTEGWIAGLQLAAVSLQGHNAALQDSAAFIQSFTGSHRFVLDYLVEEVLHQQPAHIQNFLLRTSVLDRLCAPLCDALLDAPADSPHVAGQATLEALEQANLFLIPLDNERRWYRYHHLFADFLRQRLHQRSVPSTDNEQADVAELHRRASIWYEEQGLLVEALRHALAAEDFERAAQLVELTWSVMDQSRRSATWLGWVKALPDELVQVRPVLSVGYAWALLDHGELEAAETRLQDAEVWLAIAENECASSETSAGALIVADEAEFRLLPASIAAARTYHALARGDLPATMQYARRALALFPVNEHLRRGTPAALLGLATWASGDLTEAYRAFADAMTMFQMAGNILFAITGTYFLADIRMVQGRLREATRTYQHSLQLAAGHGELVRRGTADIYTGLSELCCEQGDLEGATAHLRQSQKLGEQAALPRWRYRWSLAQARLKRAEGDLEGALAQLNAAEQHYRRGPVPDVRPIAALKARVWIAQGRLNEAWNWAREQGLAVDDNLRYLREFEHITVARLLLARYRSRAEAQQIAEAQTLLARLLDAAEAGGRMGTAIELLVLQALAHQAQGDIPTALVPLERALRLAEPEGYVQIFVDEGPPVAQLLAAAAPQGLRSAYVDQLLATLGAADPPRVDGAPPSSMSPAQPLVEPLTDRELEVLALIAAGLTNQEIAERLFLALDTVKGHNRRIFGKLAVKRRTEAVAKARALDLLPPER
jgi:LuxR family maltose regulon positive regulatory protein